jgi:RHS repeat-associated protein
MSTRYESGPSRGNGLDIPRFVRLGLAPRYNLHIAEHSRTRRLRIIVSRACTGNVVQTLDFYPYGGTRISSATSTNERRKYIGQFADDSTLSYFNARYYDGSRGQFITQDLVFLGDPKQQSLQNPQSLNSYSYANDNPITGKDPDGLALTAAQNSQLNVIKAQLLGIQAQLNSLSGNGSSGGLSALQQSVNLAGAAISRIAVGANSTISYGYQWSPPLAKNNSVTDTAPYVSTNGISNVPGGNDPVGGNMMLTALSLTPGVGELGPDEILIGGRVFQFGIDHSRAAEHLTEIGLSQAKVEQAIVKDLMTKGAPPLGAQEEMFRMISIGHLEQ